MLPFRSLFLLLLLTLNGVVGISIEPTTCSNINANIIRLALNDMVAMAQVAYDRSVGARDATTPVRDRGIVAFTFNTYFGLTEPGRSNRLGSIIGRCFWMASVRRYVANESTSGILEDFKNEQFNLNPPLVFLCDDTYLTESTIGEAGNQLPVGVYQPVSQ